MEEFIAINTRLENCLEYPSEKHELESHFEDQQLLVIDKQLLEELVENLKKYCKLSKHHRREGHNTNKNSLKDYKTLK